MFLQKILQVQLLQHVDIIVNKYILLVKVCN